MWGGRSHNAAAAAKGGSAPPGKGKSNGEFMPPPGAGPGDKRPLPPAQDDEGMSQDGGERGVRLSPLPPPRPWKVPAGTSDTRPAVAKGPAAAADGDRWHAAVYGRREGGVVGKGPLSGGAAQSGSSPERGDPRSFSPRVEGATAATYGLSSDRDDDGLGDVYNGGGDNGDDGDAYCGTSASVALRGAGVGAEPQGRHAPPTGEKAPAAADGSGRPANIIRIRIPPPPGQQAKASGRPSETKRFGSDKDLRQARSSGDTSGSHPGPSSGRLSATFPLGGGRTPSSSNGGGDGRFDSEGAGGTDDAADAVAEDFAGDEESFGEAVSMFPGKAGRKKNPVPTRAGGRTRTP